MTRKSPDHKNPPRPPVHDHPMAMREVLIVFGTAAFVTAGCTTPNGGGQAAPSTLTVTTSATPSPSVTPAGTQPCDLLTPVIAAKFAGDDAQRRLAYDDTDPPVAVRDKGCYYTGSMGSVEFRLDPIPTDPTAPVNLFHVINPENRDASLPYDAYWFGPGVSLVVVKNGQMLTFKVAPNPDTGNLDDATRAADVELANQIVPSVS
ncbi:hypothetical protein ACGFK1_12265 [Mycobacterium sp. NPDC048908]|uniref:hypothetical protein n=1 Tax=Mycobacterium sp. NPDC048908 TaxID=3364292 RepID=UPI0037240626